MFLVMGSKVGKLEWKPKLMVPWNIWWVRDWTEYL